MCVAFIVCLQTHTVELDYIIVSTGIGESFMSCDGLSF